MTSRFRFLTVLLALLAFGFAVGEPLWASTSAKAPATAAENAVACMELMSGNCDHGSHDSGSPTSPCPSMPAGMPGPCSAPMLALPAEPLAVLPPVAADQRLPGASFDMPDLLLVRGLFRPPRA